MSTDNNKSVQGDLAVSRDTTVGGDLQTRGNATVDHDLRVKGRLYIDSGNVDDSYKGRCQIAGEISQSPSRLERLGGNFATSRSLCGRRRQMGGNRRKRRRAGSQFERISPINRNYRYYNHIRLKTWARFIN